MSQLQKLTAIFVSAGNAGDRYTEKTEQAISPQGSSQMIGLHERLFGPYIGAPALLTPGVQPMIFAGEGPAVSDSAKMFSYVPSFKVAAQKLPRLSQNDREVARRFIGALPEDVGTVVWVGTPMQMSMWVGMMAGLDCKVEHGGAVVLQTLTPTTWVQASVANVPFVLAKMLPPSA